MKRNSDTIYQQVLSEISGFRFDSRVVNVFEDMIERSVPGYRAIVGMTGELAHQLAQPQTCVYDLGCSLGASSLAMIAAGLPVHTPVIAVDNSPAMLQELQSRLPLQDEPTQRLQLVEADVRDIELRPSSFVVMNFTLQFLPLADRPALIRQIYEALVPGGALLLSEKIRLQNLQTDALMCQLHHDFKRSMGYSDLEIAQKRSSLENVLIPESIGEHRSRLEQAGFENTCVWFQCFNFCSLLAIKDK